MAGSAHDAAAGMHARAAEIQPLDWRAVAGAFGRRAEREELIGCDFAVKDITVGHPIAPLDIEGAEDLPVNDSVGKIGRELR